MGTSKTSKIRIASDRLSTAFAALADPTLRAILACLLPGERSVGELAEPCCHEKPAVSKQLRVLERTGLISQLNDAQWRLCRIIEIGAVCFSSKSSKPGIIAGIVTPPAGQVERVCG
jgi:DNA-binding transcriptional ArsR family regulator